jgi:hypothetical protein
VSCSYGHDDADTTVALVGDSKAAQWAPALQVLAEQNGWRVTTFTKSRCSFTSAPVTVDGDVYDSCTEWNLNVIAQLTGPDRPDYVVTSGGRSTALADDDAAEEAGLAAMVAGLEESWDALLDAGVGVVVLEDTPATGINVYECVSEHPQNLRRCTYSREDSEGSGGALAQREAAGSRQDVAYVDLNDAVCPTAQCAPVIGNVLVYRQGSHLTSTYVETLAPRLGAALAQVMEDGR